MLNKQFQFCSTYEFHFIIIRFIPKMRFDVRFTFNRFPIRNMHRAVDIIGRESGNFWWDILFPGTEVSQRPKNPHIQIPSFYNRKIESNSQQKLAVKYFRLIFFYGGVP